MFSIGGASYSSNWDSALASNAVQLATNAANIAKQYGVGIEIDYEQDSSGSMNSLTTFVKVTFLSLSFFIFLYLSLSFFIFLYLSLSFFIFSIFPYLSLSFSIILYLSLSFSIILYHSLSAPKNFGFCVSWWRLRTKISDCWWRKSFPPLSIMYLLL